MSEKRAKRLRREARERGDVPAPKRFFKPMLVPMPSGKMNEDGSPATTMTYIPREQRRRIMRKFTTDLRKGRIKLDDRN